MSGTSLSLACISRSPLPQSPCTQESHALLKGDDNAWERSTKRLALWRIGPRVLDARGCRSCFSTLSRRLKVMPDRWARVRYTFAKWWQRGLG